MIGKIIKTIEAPDGHSFDDIELGSAIVQAVSDCEASDAQTVHYVYLSDGNMIAKITINEETLTDGSKVTSIVLHPTNVVEVGGDWPPITLT